MKTLTIKPAMHRKVTDPFRGVVLSDDSPTVVPASAYWLRRLKFGEVVLVEEKVEEKMEAAPKRRGRPKVEKENQE